jgi:hypothetical protein
VRRRPLVHLVLPMSVSTMFICLLFSHVAYLFPQRLVVSNRPINESDLLITPMAIRIDQPITFDPVKSKDH